MAFINIIENILNYYLRGTPHLHMLSPSYKCLTWKIVRSAEHACSSVSLSELTLLQNLKIKLLSRQSHGIFILKRVISILRCTNN